jgi:putative PIN family toxin of toxin-antitoxin system
VRAVLDPNVLVSALLSRSGPPAALLRAWLDGAYELVVSPALLEELARVLTYPKISARVTPGEAREFLDVLTTQAGIVQDPPGAPAVGSPDPDDDYLIALAVAAPAVLVSGDSDLLGLAGRIPVHTPAAFLAMISTT